VYQLDGGSTTTYAGPFPVLGAGSHTLTFRSTDVAGKVEQRNAELLGGGEYLYGGDLKRQPVAVQSERNFYRHCQLGQRHADWHGVFLLWLDPTGRQYAERGKSCIPFNTPSRAGAVYGLLLG
jgi:hypothetical protein